MRLGMLIWLMAGTTLAGCLLVVVLVTPALAEKAMTWIPVAGIAGFVIAIPLSMIVSKRIRQATAPRT